MLEMAVGMSSYKGQPTPVAFSVAQGPCVAQVMFVNTPTALWNGSQGTMVMPSNCQVTLIEGGEQCFIIQPDHDSKTFQFNLSGSNNNINGTGTQPFVLGNSSGIPVTVTFNGAINIYGDLTGTLTILAFGEESATITLFKQ